jgi:peptidoglycan/LPS O-acetylase OafA/YrhL
MGGVSAARERESISGFDGLRALAALSYLVA